MFWRKKSETGKQKSRRNQPEIIREVPSSLPSDGSIQVAYNDNKEPVYVYYDYDSNVFRNYLTDEQLELDELKEIDGSPFEFFAYQHEEDDNASQSVHDDENPSPETASVVEEKVSENTPESVVAQNTESFGFGEADVNSQYTAGNNANMTNARDVQYQQRSTTDFSPHKGTIGVSDPVNFPTKGPVNLDSYNVASVGKTLSNTSAGESFANLPVRGSVSAASNSYFNSQVREQPNMSTLNPAQFNEQFREQSSTNFFDQQVRSRPHSSVNWGSPQEKHEEWGIAPARCNVRSTSNGNPYVREIVESILRGEGSVEKILEKEQGLLRIQNFRENFFRDYSQLIAVVHERQRTLSAIVNDSIEDVKKIIVSMINENKQYCARIKKNALIVSEKQFVIYDELTANFQNVVSQQNSSSSGESEYEKMKWCYIECWNLRKKIVENLRIMYDLEVVISRLQNYSDFFSATSARVLESLNMTSREVDRQLVDFVSASTNRDAFSQMIASSESIRKFKENSRALLNEVDGALVGIDKRRLFERLSGDVERRKSPSFLRAARDSLPTMQIGTVSFLNDENTQGVLSSKQSAQRCVNSARKQDGSDFVSLTPNSTMRIDEENRYRY